MGRRGLACTHACHHMSRRPTWTVNLPGVTAWAADAGGPVVGVEAEVGSGMNGSGRKVRRLLADPTVTVVVVEHRDRLGRMNTELVESALAAHGRRLVVLDDGEVEDDLVRDMVEVLTSLCARLYGRRCARNRALKAMRCAEGDVGPAGVTPHGHDRVMARRLRQMAAPFVVAAPAGARIRTRLRVTEGDAAVLRAVGAHLGSLAGADLAARCAMGRQTVKGPEKHAGRADRKQRLTGLSSARWAGAITRTTADQWERALTNAYDRRRDLTRAIGTIQRRLAAPTGGKDGKVSGYRDRAERFAKQGRLQHLRSELDAVEETIVTGRVQVVRGGRRLARQRHNLADAGVTVAQWRDRWDAERLFLTADGESGKRLGNETIRICPDGGTVDVVLPAPLAGRSNTPGRARTYRLDAPAVFSHRAGEWADRVGANRAVRYDITHDAARDRWYLDASWTTHTGPPPTLEVLRAHRSVGVDLNDGHLACWVLTPDGNPTGPPITITTDMTGSRQRRDGRLRQAITDLLDLAAANGCASVTIENLDFADSRATGRETMGRGRRGRRFRRTVAGIPTAQFRQRLAGMAANRGIAIIAVDPAYTSKWGGQHWQRPLTTQTSPEITVTRHLAAAVVIGRRGQGHGARRRTGVPDSDQRIAVGELPSRPDPTTMPVRNPGPRKDIPPRPRPRQTGPPDRDRTGEPGDPTPFGTAHQAILTIAQ
jgi:hypothetical protein